MNLLRYLNPCASIATQLHFDVSHKSSCCRLNCWRCAAVDN